MDLASQERYGGGGWVDFEDFVQDLANSESDFRICWTPCMAFPLDA